MHFSSCSQCVSNIYVPCACACTEDRWTRISPPGLSSQIPHWLLLYIFHPACPFPGSGKDLVLLGSLEILRKSVLVLLGLIDSLLSLLDSPCQHLLLPLLIRHWGHLHGWPHISTCFSHLWSRKIACGKIAIEGTTAWVLNKGYASKTWALN